MFHLIRILIGTLVFFGIMLCIGPNRISRRARWCAAISTLLLVSALHAWPFENLVYTFDSPEAVCRYLGVCNKKDTPVVIYGQDTDLVLIDSGDTTRTVFTAKDPNGSKIRIGLVRPANIALTNGVSIVLYQPNKSADDFIMIFYQADAPAKVYDSEGSEFCLTEKENSFEGGFLYSQYTCIQNYDEAYWVCMNGQRIYPETNAVEDVD